MNVTLYGRNGCPKCYYCESKLKKMGDVDLVVIHDYSVVKQFHDEHSLGGELPYLDVDGTYYTGTDAVDWVKNGR